jgi:hypothetical protein
MAFNDYLAERVDRVLTEKKADFFQKKMMGDLFLWSIIRCVLGWILIRYLETIELWLGLGERSMKRLC